MSHHTCFHSKEFNDTHYGGGKHRHPWTHICTPALPLNDLTPQGERQKKRKYDSVAPSVTLIPESLSQYEHITEMSGILVFKETYFSCKSAPKYKPIAYLVLSLCHLRTLSVLGSAPGLPEWLYQKLKRISKKSVARRTLVNLSEGKNFHYSLTSFEPFNTAGSPSHICKMGTVLSLYISRFVECHGFNKNASHP